MIIMMSFMSLTSSSKSLKQTTQISTISNRLKSIAEQSLLMSQKCSTMMLQMLEDREVLFPSSLVKT